MYVVILAGGGGTRLWPLSRPERPKPFLPLLGDETLLQRTVARILPLVGSVHDVFVVTDRKYGHFVRDQVPDVQLIVEPAGRNTAAAIALATRMIERPDHEVMAVLPADHWIGKEDVFQGVLRNAAAGLAVGHPFEIELPLVTLGIQPAYASTHYGYLIPEQFGRQVIHGLSAHRLQAFEEKPTEARARELIGMPDVSWNAGMFLWQRAAIRAALEKYTPLPMLIDNAVGSELALANAYDRVTPISIDKAVMEGAASDHRVVMGGMDVGWSDIGGWTALLGALGLDGVQGHVVQPGEQITTSGDDLVIERAGDEVRAVAGADATMTATETIALLRGARPFAADVDALLARCTGAHS
ncbi:MAG TPA: mannose-1-phosphate guanylyltransferase [Candidatus Limnocylindrales bacterium]